MGGSRYGLTHERGGNNDSDDDNLVQLWEIEREMFNIFEVALLSEILIFLLFPLLRGGIWGCKSM